MRLSAPLRTPIGRWGSTTMIRTIATACAALLMGATPVLAQPEPVLAPVAVVAPVAQKLSVDSNIGALLADARAKAVLQKYWPELVASPYVAYLNETPLSRAAQYPQAKMTPSMMEQIAVELAKL